LVLKDDRTLPEKSIELLINVKFFIFTKRKDEFNMISKELLEILCCPETKADLILDGNTLVSTDKNTRRRYRIEDDIPVMLIDESEQLSVEEWREVMKRHGKSVE
jgi:uncharacterized protein YbaR (Trm112 family)